MTQRLVGSVSRQAESVARGRSEASRMLTPLSSNVPVMVQFVGGDFGVKKFALNVPAVGGAQLHVIVMGLVQFVTSL